MKRLASLSIAALLLASGANAFAQTTSSGLTRAKVHAQLVQAEADGILPNSKLDYPPSPETIARNKQLYAIRHAHDQANAMAAISQNNASMTGTTD